MYTSGRFKVEFEKTTAAYPIAPAKNKNVIVWDLRFSPEDFLDWSAEQILENITADFETRSQADFKPIAAKILQYNKCPAVAPIGVLNEENQERLNLKLADIQKNLDLLRKNPHFAENIRSAFEREMKFRKSDMKILVYLLRLDFLRAFYREVMKLRPRLFEILPLES